MESTDSGIHKIYVKETVVINYFSDKQHFIYNRFPVSPKELIEVSNTNLNIVEGIPKKFEGLEPCIILKQTDIFQDKKLQFTFELLYSWYKEENRTIEDGLNVVWKDVSFEEWRNSLLKTPLSEKQKNDIEKAWFDEAKSLHNIRLPRIPNNVVLPYDSFMATYIAGKEFYNIFSTESKVIYFGNDLSKLKMAVSNCNYNKIVLKRNYSSNGRNVQILKKEEVVGYDKYNLCAAFNPNLKTCVQPFLKNHIEFRLCMLIKNGEWEVIGGAFGVHKEGKNVGYYYIDDKLSDFDNFDIIKMKVTSFGQGICKKLVSMFPDKQHTYYRVDVFYDLDTFKIILNEIDTFASTHFFIAGSSILGFPRYGEKLLEIIKELNNVLNNKLSSTGISDVTLRLIPNTELVKIW